MIEFPDNGYSPDNLKALVKATNLNKIDFIKQFKLSKAMFYRYQNGETTMQHDDWLSLKSAVEVFINAI